MAIERSLSPAQYRRARNRRRVPGITPGMVVYHWGGRAFRVVRNDEWVCYSDHYVGPYARLRALDDKSVEVIWPRAWYSIAGQQLELDLELPIELASHPRSGS